MFTFRIASGIVIWEGSEPQAESLSLMKIPNPSWRLIAVWVQQLRLWYLVTDFSLNHFRWLYPADEKHPGDVLDGSHPRITACIRQLKIRFAIPSGRCSLNRFRYHHLLWGRFRKFSWILLQSRCVNCSLPQGIKFITPGCLYNSLDYGLLTAAEMAVIITATPQ